MQKIDIETFENEYCKKVKVNSLEAKDSVKLDLL